MSQNGARASWHAVDYEKVDHAGVLAQEYLRRLKASSRA